MTGNARRVHVRVDLQFEAANVKEITDRVAQVLSGGAPVGDFRGYASIRSNERELVRSQMFRGLDAGYLETEGSAFTD